MENIGSEIRSFERGYLIAGRYLVDSQLGSGGMGAVYKVLDTKLDNEAIALKILYPHHVKDQVTLARFRNEVLVARKLNHPNVTRIYDFGEGESGSVFITMEYVEGRSFGEYIYAPRHERMIFGEIVEVLYEVASGMAHAHKMGVIHRDLKPDNVLISSSREIKITDFGLARNMEIDKRFTQTGEAVGTPYYMAPEQLRGLKLDNRCDIYAFGIIAFEAASGQRPFQDETYLNLAALHLKAEVPSIRQVQPGIPDWFEEMIYGCLEKKPEDRFQSMDEVRDFISSNRSDVGRNTVSRPAISAAFNTGERRRKRLNKKRNSKMRRFLLPGLVLLAALFVSLLSTYILKNNETANSNALSVTLKAERALGISLSGVKSFLGSDLALSPAALFKAVRDGDERTVSVLLKAGVSANSLDQSGESLLLVALRENNTNIARELLIRGANGSISGVGGITPLMQAVDSDLPEIVDLLLNSFVDVNDADALGSTALIRGVNAQNIPLVSKLLRKGAAANFKDQSGKTALIYAAELGNTNLAELLVENGATLDEQDLEGHTALMYAAITENVELAKFLINSGADVSLRNNRKRTATALAPRKIRYEMEDTLKARRLKDTPRNSSSESAGTSSSANKLTRLRLSGKPRGVFQGRSTVSLAEVVVDVRNAGEVTAESVEVEVEIPSGKTVRLDGPTSISRKKMATYKWTGAEDVTVPYMKGNRKLKPTTKCSNCRKGR